MEKKNNNNKILIYKYLFLSYRIIKLIYFSDIIQIVYLFYDLYINKQFELIFDIMYQKLKLFHFQQSLSLDEVESIEEKKEEIIEGEEKVKSQPSFYEKYKYYILGGMAVFAIIIIIYKLLNGDNPNSSDIDIKLESQIELESCLRPDLAPDLAPDLELDPEPRPCQRPCPRPHLALEPESELQLQPQPQIDLEPCLRPDLAPDLELDPEPRPCQRPCPRPHLALEPESELQLQPQPQIDLRPRYF